MNQRVTEAGRDSDGDITALGGPWGTASKAEAIRDSGAEQRRTRARPQDPQNNMHTNQRAVLDPRRFRAPGCWGVALTMPRSPVRKAGCSNEPTTCVTAV